VIAVLGPEPDAGALVEPETAPLRPLGRHLEPLTPPDPFDALGVHDPPSIAQQGRDPPIAIAALLLRQRDDVGHEQVVIVFAPWRLALRRAMLSERRANAALGHGQLPLHMLDADAPTRGAQ
jgi:hypothetical protein